MSTNDPSGPSSFEPPKPHEQAPHPVPDTASEAAGAAESAAGEAASEAADAGASAADAAESAERAAAAAPAEAGAAASEPVTAVTPTVDTTASQPVVAEPTAVTPVVMASAPPTTKTKRKHGPVRVLAILVVVAGVILIAAGAVTWFVVRDQLGAEKITVSDDASHFGGDAVDGPLTAYAQADAIKKHALAASGGLTYAQLPQDDPKRNTVMTASFLRASLYTSVVSFGVAVFAAGVGLVLILIGWALLRVDHSLRRL